MAERNEMAGGNAMAEGNEMPELFDSLNVNPSLIKALGKENITIPTEIQKKVIPAAKENKDLIVRSETGTGKTLAYLLPLFEKIDTSAREMQALILTPTHELAIQVQRVIEQLAQNSDLKVSATPIIGNVNIVRQIEKLKEKPHIIVGSTGRILELIKKKKISAHTIKTIILDEADRLLDENNIDTVKAVVKSTLKERQMMAFSATMPQAAVEKAKEMMKEPVILRSEGPVAVPPTIEHLFFVADQRDKVEVLRKLVRIINPQKAVVFINKSEEIELLTMKLKYHRIKAESIHGANFKLERKRIMDEFRTGKLQLLVASDIAARGLDIGGVTHVFNMDMPEDPKDYLHRVGRTGRSGNTGVAISIISKNELERIKMYEKTLKISIISKDIEMGKIIDYKKNQRKLQPNVSRMEKRN